MTYQRIFVAMLFVLLAVPPAAAQSMTVETATGAVEIPARPDKVAVFDIAAIDTLEHLGVMPAGVPDRLYLPELADLASEAQIVGTLFEPDLEALSELQPDLIIVGGRSSPRAASASRVAPTIDMSIRDASLVADARSRIHTYGRLFGREAQAEAALRALDAAIEGARAAIDGKGTGLIIMTNGPKISAYGPGSRFGWLHEELGLTPAMENVKAAIHGEAVSFEFIRKADPDWLIVVDRAAAIGSNDANARATLDNALVRGTKAWQRDQVIYLPAGDVYIAAGGVQAMTRVLTALTEAFGRAE